MLRKILAALAVAVMVTLGGLTPARADDPIKELATINGCDPNNVCLYDWINNNYSSGFWQRSLPTFTNSADGGQDNCIDLSKHKWHDLVGSPNNTSSSMIINLDGTFTGARFWYFNDGSCSSPGNSVIYRTVPGSTIIEPNLASSTKDPACYNFRCSWNWYDRISSIYYENG